MQAYAIDTKWRDGGSVEVVTEPTQEWFESVHCEDGVRLFRISVLNNCEIFFGDAHVVLHADIMRMRPRDRVEPILVAVFGRKDDEPWRICNSQHWGTRVSDTSLSATRSLLARLRVWDDVIVPALGNDPLMLPSMQEEFYS